MIPGIKTERNPKTGLKLWNTKKKIKAVTNIMAINKLDENRLIALISFSVRK